MKPLQDWKEDAPARNCSKRRRKSPNWQSGFDCCLVLVPQYQVTRERDAIVWGSSH